MPFFKSIQPFYLPTDINVEQFEAYLTNKAKSDALTVELQQTNQRIQSLLDTDDNLTLQASLTALSRYKISRHLHQDLDALHQSLIKKSLFTVKDTVETLKYVNSILPSLIYSNSDPENALKRALEQSNPQLHSELKTLQTTKENLELQINTIKPSIKNLPQEYKIKLNKTLRDTILTLIEEYELNVDVHAKPNSDPIIDAQATLARRFFNYLTSLKSEFDLKKSVKAQFDFELSQILNPKKADQNSSILNKLSLTPFVQTLNEIVQVHESNLMSVKDDAQCKLRLTQSIEEDNSTLHSVLPEGSNLAASEAPNEPMDNANPNVALDNLPPVSSAAHDLALQTLLNSRGSVSPVAPTSEAPNEPMDNANPIVALDSLPPVSSAAHDLALQTLLNSRGSVSPVAPTSEEPNEQRDNANPTIVLSGLLPASSSAHNLALQTLLNSRGSVSPVDNVIDYSFYLKVMGLSLVATGLILLAVGITGFALPAMGIVAAAVTVSVGALSAVGGGLLFFSQNKNKPHDTDETYTPAMAM